MFNNNQFLSKRLNITRVTVLLIGIFIPLFWVLNYLYYPEFYDPIYFRLGIAMPCLVLYTLSYYSESVKINFDWYVYTMFLFLTLWLQLILYKNNLHPAFALGLFIAFIGMSMGFNKSLYLRIYILFFTIATHITVNIIDAPLVPVKLFISLFTVLALIDLLIIDAFIQSFKKLQFSNSNFKALINSVNEAYFLLDKNYKIIKLNQKGKDFINKRSNKAVKEGSHILDFIILTEVEHFIAHYKKALVGEKSTIETSIKTLKEDIEWYEIKFLPVKSRTDEITGVLYSAANISDSKMSQELMEQKNRELQKTNLELDHFVYSAAHDLRAPLTSLLGLINLTKKESSSPEIQTYMKFMEKSVKKLDGYIKDIVAYSSNERTEIEGGEVNFQNIIQEVFNDYHYLESASAVRHQIKITSDTPFFSDSRRIKIILNNLICNCLKFYDKHKVDPYIYISIEISETAAIIKVQDNGVGIQDLFQEKIFNMFFRASDKSDGSGLGLYIVKETITKLNGTISVSSFFGQGTSFLIKIPNSFVPHLQAVSSVRKIG